MVTMITNTLCWLPIEFRESIHSMAVGNLADIFWTSAPCNSNVGILRDTVVNLIGFVSLEGAHLSGAAGFVLDGDWEWMVGFRNIVMKERSSMKDEWYYKRTAVGDDMSNIARRRYAWCVWGLKVSLAWLKGRSQPSVGRGEMGRGELDSCWWQTTKGLAWGYGIKAVLHFPKTQMPVLIVK